MVKINKRSRRPSINDLLMSMKFVDRRFSDRSAVFVDTVCSAGPGGEVLGVFGTLAGEYFAVYPRISDKGSRDIVLDFGDVGRMKGRPQLSYAFDVLEEKLRQHKYLINDDNLVVEYTYWKD